MYRQVTNYAGHRVSSSMLKNNPNGKQQLQPNDLLERKATFVNCMLDECDIESHAAVNRPLEMARLSVPSGFYTNSPSCETIFTQALPKLFLIILSLSS